MHDNGDDVIELQEGQIIRTDALPCPAEVKQWKRVGSRYHLEAVLQDNNVSRSIYLSPEQAQEIEVVGSDEEPLMDPLDFFFGMEAYRIRLAHQFDPLLALSTSQVEPLPHQIDAVYDYALSSHRMRFMIADDPGSGKTIMAGLVIRELQFRQRVKRILIVAPGHLKYQWRREMEEKFGCQFQLMDRNLMNVSSSVNPWEQYSQVITSLDFAKQEDVRDTLRGVYWDLVVVDEAHKMSATAYESKEGLKTDKTLRYRLGEVLSDHCDQMLFLTATPHRGDDEGFRMFLDLLRPGFFADPDMITEASQRGDNPLFVRRLKEDMQDFDGQPIFPPRHVQSLEFRLSDAERDLYNAVTRYVQDYFDMAQENRHISFAMMILQRRLSSSANAILTSLQRRKDRLEEALWDPEARREYLGFTPPERDEFYDLPQDEREEIEYQAEMVVGSTTERDLRTEIQHIEGLIDEAERVRAQEVESKLVALRDNILSALGDRKLLVFTEFTDTLQYLEAKLRQWGYEVCTIHGGMSMEERLEAERVFAEEAQIMVATEAAGEGINLQFCSLMVNYDIPWNPNRLEQRMGRVHRFGQKYEVYIWNMIGRDTREGQVMKRLFEKLERMRVALGDRVFDVINELVSESELEDMIMGAIWGQKSMDEVATSLDEVDEGEAQEVIDRLAGKALATSYIDYSGLLERTQVARENRLVPEYVQDFFLRAAERMNLRIEEREDGYAVTWVPYDYYREHNDDTDFVERHGHVRDRYNRITFDKSIARDSSNREYVAPGHPLLEATLASLLRLTDKGAPRTVFEDPNHQLQGSLWFLEGAIMDGTGEPAARKVFCLYRGDDGEIREINPSVLWDLEPASEKIRADRSEEDEFSAESDVIGESIDLVLEPFLEEIREHSEREARVKERYGLRSLKQQILESQSKLLEYSARAEEGEDMDVAIYNERHRSQQLEARKEELQREIRLQKSVTIEAPRVLGVAAVVPAASTEDAVSACEDDVPEDLRPEVERVGMQVTMEYEERSGWEPQDVSDENLGYDVRSMQFAGDGTFRQGRYIEVKARARTGAIRLTANEWKMARKLRDEYWLYIVTDAFSESPVLTRIQDPAQHFREEQDIFATGFVIHEEAWRPKGEAVNMP